MFEPRLKAKFPPRTRELLLHNFDKIEALRERKKWYKLISNQTEPTIEAELGSIAETIEAELVAELKTGTGLGDTRAYNTIKPGWAVGHKRYYGYLILPGWERLLEIDLICKFWVEFIDNLDDKPEKILGVLAPACAARYWGGTPAEDGAVPPRRLYRKQDVQALKAWKASW